jgi:hypothetical protein
MSPLLVQFLRRLAALALVLAVLLLVLPRLLTELGVLGPTAEEKVGAAAAALEAARGYGGDDSLPAFAAAQKALDEARGLLQSGRTREARAAADRAAAGARIAQRDALVRRDEQRQRAEAIANEADRRLNELEALYGRAGKLASKARVAELLALMKTARQAGSGLILRYEQDDFARVIAEQPAAFETLDSIRKELREASGL